MHSWYSTEYNRTSQSLLFKHDSTPRTYRTLYKYSKQHFKMYKQCIEKKKNATLKTLIYALFTRFRDNYLTRIDNGYDFSD